MANSTEISYAAQPTLGADASDAVQPQEPPLQRPSTRRDGRAHGTKPPPLIKWQEAKAVGTRAGGLSRVRKGSVYAGFAEVGFDAQGK